MDNTLSDTQQTGSLRALRHTRTKRNNGEMTAKNALRAPKEHRQIWTLSEVATWAGVSESCLRKAHRLGELPGAVGGGRHGLSDRRVAIATYARELGLESPLVSFENAA